MLFLAEECSMDLDSGPCNDYLPTWGFNKTVGLCQPFVYSGCEGNDNRFETKDACDHKCGPKGKNINFYFTHIHRCVAHKTVTIFTIFHTSNMPVICSQSSGKY